MDFIHCDLYCTGHIQLLWTFENLPTHIVKSNFENGELGKTQTQTRACSLFRFGPSLFNNHSHWWIKTCEWNLYYVMSNFQGSLRSNKIRQHQPCLISPTPLGFIRPGMVCMYIFFIVCFLKRVEFSSKKKLQNKFLKNLNTLTFRRHTYTTVLHSQGKCEIKFKKKLKFFWSHVIFRSLDIIISKIMELEIKLFL